MKRRQPKVRGATPVSHGSPASRGCAAFIAALRLLANIANKIIQSPEESKFRTIKIRKSQKVFQRYPLEACVPRSHHRRVGRWKGAVHVLLDMGFAPGMTTKQAHPELFDLIALRCCGGRDRC